jgi:hypothetical protein
VEATWARAVEAAAKKPNAAAMRLARDAIERIALIAIHPDKDLVAPGLHHLTGVLPIPASEARPVGIPWSDVAKAKSPRTVAGRGSRMGGFHRMTCRTDLAADK